MAEMNDKDFPELVDSIKEAEAIQRGVREPSHLFDMLLSSPEDL